MFIKFTETWNMKSFGGSAFRKESIDLADNDFNF